MKKIVLIFSLILLTSFVVAVSVQLSEFQGTVNVPDGYTVTAGISENNMPYGTTVKDETYNIIIMCDNEDVIYFRINGKLADETGICEPYNVEPINVDLTVDFAPEDYAPACGNGIIEPGEQCEENNFAEMTCQDFGYDMGDLKCVNCQRDLSDCSYDSPEDDDDTPDNTGGNDNGDRPGGGTTTVVATSEDGLTTISAVDDVQDDGTIDLISDESQETIGSGITGGVIGFVKSGVGMGLTFAVLLLIVGIGVMAFRKKKKPKASKKE